MARLRPIGDLQDLPKVHTFCAHHTGRRLASRFSGRKRSDSRSVGRVSRRSLCFHRRPLTGAPDRRSIGDGCLSVCLWRAYQRLHLVKAVQPAHSKPVIAAERASDSAVGKCTGSIIRVVPTFDARCGK
jgi:hypothetical protein